MGRFFCEFWLFSRENRPKSADCSANFDFFPAKIPRNRPIFPRICPWKSREILLFFRETSEALAIAKQIFRPRGQLQVNFSVKKKDPGQSRLSSSIMLMDNDKQASEKIRQVEFKRQAKELKHRQALWDFVYTPSEQWVCGANIILLCNVTAFSSI